MKTSKKTKYLFLSLILCICVTKNAYTKIFSPSIKTGIKYCSVYELLNSKYSSVSKLVWKNPLNPYFGFNGNIYVSNFICNVDIDFSISNAWGIMEDFDYYMSGEICQYSKHTNHLDNDHSFYVDFGYDFNLKKLSVTPMIGCQYQSREFSAVNGYLQIPEIGKNWEGNEEKRIISGKGIDYEQKLFLPFIKMSINYSFKKDFSIRGSIRFSPYLYATCTDTHYFRNKQFIDKINGGFCLCGEAKLHLKKYSFVFSNEYLKTFPNAETYTQDIGITDSKRYLCKNYIPGIESSIWYVGIEYTL